MPMLRFIINTWPIFILIFLCMIGSCIGWWSIGNPNVPMYINKPLAAATIKDLWMPVCFLSIVFLVTNN